MKKAKKKDKDKKAKTPKKKAEKKSKEKKSKEKKLTRKAFIMQKIEEAGSNGITTKSLVEKTDKQFGYGDGKSSQLRVTNTIRDGVGSGQLSKKDDKVYWK